MFSRDQLKCGASLTEEDFVRLGKFAGGPPPTAACGKFDDYLRAYGIMAF
jgi:hypothetical protein